MEVPLHELQAKTDAAKKTLSVHCSLAALVKDAKGEVVQKLSRDRSFQVTADQLKMGNFVDKMMVARPPGKYTLESAVMDRESGKIGTARSEFTIAPKGKGVGISSLTRCVRLRRTPRDSIPTNPFSSRARASRRRWIPRFTKAPDAVLRLFFVVYRTVDSLPNPRWKSNSCKTARASQRCRLPLPEADAQGRIPYVMTVPAAGIPPGSTRFVPRPGRATRRR